jgi:general secretion pathway protein A
VFQDFLAENAGLLSRRTAVERILKQWEITGRLLADVSEPMDDLAFFSMAANRQGLTATPVNQDFHQMIRLNLPAVLRFYHPAVEAPLYLTAVRALPAAMVFSAGEEGLEVEVPYDKMVKYWSGDAVVFWKNFYHYRGTIPVDAPGESVITLKLHLRDMGFSHIEISGIYDPATRWAVQAIQARHGIPVDGVVGPLTKIVLYNEKSSLPIPHLWDQINIPDKLPAFEMLENDVDQTLSHPALRPE